MKKFRSQIMDTQQNNIELKTLVKDILDFGDLLIISNKGYGKTNSLMVLAEEFMNLPHCRTIIFETFPKWINEFSMIPYAYINDDMVIERDNAIYYENPSENYGWFSKDRTYFLRNSEEIGKILDSNKNLLFCLEIEDYTRLSWFVTLMVYQFYRTNYLTAYKYGIQKIKYHVVFIIEEAQNILDRTVVDKKIFNKLRKMFSEARNLKIHFIMATQRCQDINTRIRGRSRFLIGKVNLDDYNLKIRRLLRNSKYCKQVLTLPKGSFIYPDKDVIVKFPKFKPNGKPYEIPIEPIEQYYTIEREHRKNGVLQWIKNKILGE